MTATFARFYGCLAGLVKEHFDIEPDLITILTGFSLSRDSVRMSDRGSI